MTTENVYNLINPGEMIENSKQFEDCNDLCVTCKNFSTCMYAESANRPVHFCEEFEVYSYRPANENPNPDPPEMKEEKIVFYGLCKNCGNRMTCMMASPDRIIWHCEEYV
jgi:hypothetical protein